MASPLLERSEAYRTRIRWLDHQHKELIGRINELHRNLVAEGTTEAVGDFVDEVYARISADFALEETIMRERKYDGYREHKDDHERLLDDIRDIIDGFEAGDVAVTDGEVATVFVPTETINGSVPTPPDAIRRMSS